MFGGEWVYSRDDGFERDGRHAANERAPALEEEGRPSIVADSCQNRIWTDPPSSREQAFGTGMERGNKKY